MLKALQEASPRTPLLTLIDMEIFGRGAGLVELPSLVGQADPFTQTMPYARGQPRTHEARRSDITQLRTYLSTMKAAPSLQQTPGLMVTGCPRA